MTDKIMQAARAVSIVAKEHARTGELAGRLTGDVLAELAGTGLLRMGMPACLGGPEIDPVTSAKAIMVIAEGDAAAAWYPTVSSATSIFTHYLPEEAAREIFDDAAPVGCSGMPRGEGEFVDGGLRVGSGRWPWGSAGAVAGWMGFGMVVDGRMVLGFLPAADFVVEDNWDVAGMRATASGDFSACPGAFVPRRRLIDTTELKPMVDVPLTRFPMTAYSTHGFAAVAIGNAFGALTELLALAAKKTPLGMSNKLAESPLAQIDIARAEARLHAARAFYLETLDELWQNAVAGAESSSDLRARARLAMSHAAAESAAVIDSVCPLGGGSVVFSANPLQKRQRDAHVITQQTQVSSWIFPLYGKIRLGVEMDEAARQFAT